MQPTPDFKPAVAAKKLLREGRSGALATLMAGSGDPYCSLVNVATASDGAPLLLISRLAVHTRNILADPRVSLMVDERRAGDPLEGARVMLMGTAAATGDAASRRRYLARQPAAEMLTGFADFAFYRIEPRAAPLEASSPMADITVWLLPEPDSPTMATNSPGLTSMSMPFTASTSPSPVRNSTLRSRTARMGSAVMGSCPLAGHRHGQACPDHPRLRFDPGKARRGCSGQARA